MGKAKAIVVGAGFGGLAAAIRLRAKGYEVDLVDRCSAPGGRAQTFHRDGFRHDAGPTVITASFLLEELFALHGRRMEDYVKLVHLDPWYRFRFPDGTYFNYGGSVEDTLAEIRQISPEDCDGYLALVEESKKIFAVGFEELADKPFHSLGTMIGLLPSLVALGGYRSVWQLVTKYIHHPWLQRAFSVSPLLVGGNPFDTTSIYSLIHYLERKWGIQFAMGGTGALVGALVKLMDEIGVIQRYGATVEEILVEGGKARGVALSTGERLAADIVVSDADAAFLYSKMIRKPALVPRMKLKFAQSSMGLFVLYFGTTKRYEDVAHHTIWFGDRYRELLSDIFHKHHLGEDFSLYVHRPTATDASFAPPGCDSWYVLAPVPNLQSGTDWSEVAESYGDSILKALSETMMPDLEQHITARFHMDTGGFSGPLSERSWSRLLYCADPQAVSVVSFPQQGGRRRGPVSCGCRYASGGGPARCTEQCQGAGSSDSALCAAMTKAYPQNAAETMKLHGKSFWFASLFLPRQVARDAARLYSFCRRMDDLADIAVSQENRDVLAKVRLELQSGVSADPVVVDFLALAKQYDLPVDAADWIVGTFLQDAKTPMLVADGDELIRYCYGVAGTVGLMMSPILGADRARAGGAAICLGVAMQMTNIARDILEDAREGRRYLPGEWVHDVSPQSLVVCKESRPMVALAAKQLLDLADGYYALAVEGLPWIPSRSRRGIAIAAAVYREIGVELRKGKYAWWDGRVNVSLWRKLWVALRVLVGQSDLDRLKVKQSAVDLWSPLQGLPGVE